MNIDWASIVTEPSKAQLNKKQLLDHQAHRNDLIAAQRGRSGVLSGILSSRCQV